uniref:ORF38 n=1 Tax=Malaco herpesvirus 1 TaxID=3031797 RepID=A0AA48P930_9VIRU|nr:TPA_asm: ORF38 [Malaco herpesvirus 1]
MGKLTASLGLLLACAAVINFTGAVPIRGKRSLRQELELFVKNLNDGRAVHEPLLRLTEFKRGHTINVVFEERFSHDIEDLLLDESADRESEEIKSDEEELLPLPFEEGEFLTGPLEEEELVAVPLGEELVGVPIEEEELILDTSEVELTATEPEDPTVDESVVTTVNGVGSTLEPVFENEEGSTSDEVVAQFTEKDFIDPEGSRLSVDLDELNTGSDQAAETGELSEDNVINSHTEEEFIDPEAGKNTQSIIQPRAGSD